MKSVQLQNYEQISQPESDFCLNFEKINYALQFETNTHVSINLIYLFTFLNVAYVSKYLLGPTVYKLDNHYFL